MADITTMNVGGTIYDFKDAKAARTSHKHAVSDITGPIPVENGGTGATASDAARSNLGLSPVSTYPEYSTVSDVRSVPVIGPDGVMEVGSQIDFHKKGSTKDFDVRIGIRDDGNIALWPALTILAGGTGATTVEGARTNLGAQAALSPKTIASGTLTLCGVTYKVYAIAYGKVVHLFAKLASGTLTAPGATTVHSDVSIQIPEGYRHMEDEFNEIYISGWCDAQKSVTLGFYLIRTGEVYLACSSYGTLSDVHAVSFSATYIAE